MLDRSPIVTLPADPDATDRLLVLGDLHGDLPSLEAALRRFQPGSHYLVCLGDYADRGDHGVEVIQRLHALHRDAPSRVILLKGNHELFTPEGTPLFRPCSLLEEATAKYGTWRRFLREQLTSFLSRLNLGVAVPGCALLVHGGVSSKVTSWAALEAAPPPLEEDLLWSDPQPNQGERYNRSRGVGVLFGPDVTQRVCDRLGIVYIVRSHEPLRASAGPVTDHAGHVITISSTRVYGGASFLLDLPINHLTAALSSVQNYAVPLL